MARHLLNFWASSMCAQSRLEITIYGTPGSCYPGIVYVQGNLYLRAYSDQVGAPASGRQLHDYYADYRLGIGGTRQQLGSQRLKRT